MTYLTTDQCQRFDEKGYLVFEALIEPDLNERIKGDFDQMMDDIAYGRRKPVMSYDQLGPLTSEPVVVDRVADLMGGSLFTHHHIHARWQVEGEPGVEWHHDYEQFPQTNRSHLMVHVFFYPHGLNGEVGDLLVLPGSHKQVMTREALRMFGFDDLPGSVTVDDLPPGSAVLVHSAMIHARRPKPGGQHYRRYFIDTSYCQAGTLWPGYRSIESINAIALEKGFDRNGKYAFLYDTSQFFDAREAWQRSLQNNEGSLAQAPWFPPLSERPPTS